MKEKVICWDLDETLGEFRQVAYEMASDALAGTKDGEYFKQLAQETPLGIRAGLKELLVELSKEGYVHFVNTAGRTEYAVEALQKTNLTPFFQGVYGIESTGPENLTGGFGKLFHPIARYMNYTDEQAIQNMVVMGDGDGDTPVDINGLVTIIDRYGPYHDTPITRTALNALQELGEGNFDAGFKNLHTQSRPVYQYESIEYQKIHQERKITVDDNFLFCLFYRATSIFEGVVRVGTSEHGCGVYVYNRERTSKGLIPRLIIEESRGGFMRPEILDLRRDLELF